MHRIRADHATESANRRTLAYQVLVALLVLFVIWAVFGHLSVNIAGS